MTAESLAPAAPDDVDWDLLALLARTDAALSRPDPSLPDGLDLSHPGDYALVWQIADAAAP